jgi:L-lactate dehydrogenase (cytochrome)
MEAAARRRLPRFAFDYLAGGIGRGDCLAENLAALKSVKLRPRYLSDEADRPDCAQTLFGRTYDAPFGVAPVGLGGLIWPRAAEHLAVAAENHKLPFVLSSFATSSVEDIAEAVGRCAWFQLYPTVDDDVDRDMLRRARAAGCEVLVVTVDVPTETRRDHDLRNGLSVPPRFDPRTITEMAVRPRWALAMLHSGVPRFRNLAPYIPEGAGLAELGRFLADLVEGHVTAGKLKRLRGDWPGKLVVKGILDPEDARLCRSIGADALVVSNHGGRQLDAAEPVTKVLGLVREAVGPDMPLLADGGVRTGLDIARLIACGADFVLGARAFMFALGACGAPGANHVMKVLKAEFRMTLAQIGCPHVAALPDFMVD